MWVLVIPFENVWQSYDGEIFSPLHSYYRIRRASWFDPMVSEAICLWFTEIF